MTNYKVRAAGNDNVVLFIIRGFSTDSLTAGLDILENIYCWGQLLGRMNFLFKLENLPPCPCPTLRHLLLDMGINLYVAASLLVFYPQSH